MSDGCRFDYKSDSVKLFIDNVEIPLKVGSIDGARKTVHLFPLFANFRVDSPSLTGRTFEANIVTPKWPLKQSDSRIECRSPNQVNKFVQEYILEDYNDCTMFTNKLNIFIPPHEWTPVYSIITYTGKRADKECDFKFDVSFVTRIVEASQQCVTKCRTEIAEIPAKIARHLVTDTGVILPIPIYKSIVCSEGNNGVNNTIAWLIKEVILNYAKCSFSNMTVKIETTGKESNCMKVTLKDSPVKFKAINIGGTLYDFNTSSC